MKMIYPAVFYPYSDGSGGYVVEFPDLPGCVTGGKNLEEAIEMAVDAASGWILDELEEGNQVPQASKYEEVEPKKMGKLICFYWIWTDMQKDMGKKQLEKM